MGKVKNEHWGTDSDLVQIYIAVIRRLTQTVNYCK